MRLSMKRVGYYALLLLAVFLVPTVVAESENGAQGNSSAHNDEQRELSDQEVSFLNCALECRSDKAKLFSCLGNCQNSTGIPANSISNIMYMGIGNGVTETECRDHLGSIVKTGFVCPEFSTGCCCEGFFDCKNMEDKVVDCKVTTCTKDIATGREICSCNI